MVKNGGPLWRETSLHLQIEDLWMGEGGWSWMEDLCLLFQFGKFIRIRAEELWNAYRLGTSLAEERTAGVISPTLGNPRLEAN